MAYLFTSLFGIQYAVLPIKFQDWFSEKIEKGYKSVLLTSFYWKRSISLSKSCL